MDEHLPGQQAAAQRDHGRVEPEPGPLFAGAARAAQGQHADEGERVAGEVEHVRGGDADEAPRAHDLQEEEARVSQPEEGEGPGQPPPSAPQLRGQRRLVGGPGRQPDGAHARDEATEVAEDVHDGVADGGPQQQAGEGHDVDRQENDRQALVPRQEGRSPHGPHAALASQPGHPTGQPRRRPCRFPGRTPDTRSLFPRLASPGQGRKQVACHSRVSRRLTDPADGPAGPGTELDEVLGQHQCAAILDAGLRVSDLLREVAE